MVGSLRRTCWVLAVVLVAGASTVPGRSLPHALAAAPTRPNIVFILTDDMRWDELGNMSTLQSELIGKGVWFKSSFVVNSLCCPSRATALTGQYSHTTGVWTNVSSPTGGYTGFLPRQGSTVATWLHDAGYRTALVGKYLNGYGPTPSKQVPPGWDRWVAFTGSPNYFDYTLSLDGTASRFGSAPSDYSTDVLASYATSFIRSVPSSQPLLLWFSPNAPHAPFRPAPRHVNSLPNFVGVRPPNLAEADVSDKPAWVRARHPAGTWDATRKKQLQTLLAVDDAIASVLQALTETGRLEDTLIAFASDNGLSGGSHRWTAKESPWDEAIRVPLIVRYDAITHGVGLVDHHLVTNLDYAPTFARLADVGAPGAEGASLLPLLSGGATSWRTEFLIEHLQAGHGPPTYCAVRTQRYKYIKYATGEEELYDLSRDPYELESLHDDQGFENLKRQMRADLVARCSPPPPGLTP